MLHLGVDPGKSGGLAMISTQENYIYMQTMPDNFIELREFFRKAKECTIFEKGIHCWLEKAQTMPKQGIVSAFNYGKHFGELCATLALLEIPYSMVSPIKWTKAMHSNAGPAPTAKAKTLMVARRLYPKEKFLATARSKVPHNGMVDALMIAHYGMQFGGLK